MRTALKNPILSPSFLCLKSHIVLIKQLYTLIIDQQEPIISNRSKLMDNLGIEAYTIFTNKYCQVSQTRTGYVVHSLSGKYPDKQCETLTGVSLQTQIPLYTLKAAQKAADATLPL